MAIIRRSKEVLVADFPQSKVILNLETYIPYILNHTASELWDFLKKPKGINKIVAFLQERYKINIMQAKKDSQNFIQDLERIGLIKSRSIK
jgi:hypothetical protein